MPYFQVEFHFVLCWFMLIQLNFQRGKFRPNLVNLVQMNTPRVVQQETKKAFRKLQKTNDLQSAANALCNLKGVGPGLASGEPPTLKHRERRAAHQNQKTKQRMIPGTQQKLSATQIFLLKIRLHKNPSPFHASAAWQIFSTIDKSGAHQHPQGRANGKSQSFSKIAQRGASHLHLDQPEGSGHHFGLRFVEILSIPFCIDPIFGSFLLSFLIRCYYFSCTALFILHELFKCSPPPPSSSEITNHQDRSARPTHRQIFAWTIDFGVH